MKYSLAIFNDAKIKEIDDFSKIPEFEELDGSKLEDIMKFTTEFSNEEDLIIYLAKSGCIEKEDATGHLKIISNNKKKDNRKIFTSEIIYNKYSDLISYNKLESTYLNLMNCTDFLHMFLKKYYVYLFDTPFQKDLSLINEGYNLLYGTGSLRDIHYSAMSSFLYRMCHNKTKKGNTLRYKSMYELITLVKEYYEKGLQKEDPYKKKLEDIRFRMEQLNEILSINDNTDEQNDIYNNELNSLEKELEKDEIILARRR